MAFDPETERRISELWKEWRDGERLGKWKVAMNYMDLRWLFRDYAQALEDYECDPALIDFDAIIDPTLTRDENMELLMKEIQKYGRLTEEAVYDKYFEEARSKIEEEARAAGVLEEYEKEIDKVKRELRKEKKKYWKAEELVYELRSKVKGLEEETERLKRDIEARKLVRMVTVRFKVDVPKFVGVDEKEYGPFKEGEIASIPEGNAAILIERGVVEPWVLAPPPPVKVPISEIVRGAIKELREL